jgi:anti-sigma regulatory factor (Ser/Thr protein kinase)
VHLHVAREGGEVVATIVDAGQWRSPRGKHRGRGLALLDGAADAVHIERSHSGTRVVLRKTVRGWAR